MMKKLWVVFYMVCLLAVPVLAHAQLNQLFVDVFGQGGRGVGLDQLRVVQMEMIPEFPRDEQPVTFRAVVENSSRQELRIILAVVDRDRVVAMVSDAYLRPGSNRIDFPETKMLFSRGEQQCFTIETNVDRRWVPVSMAGDFCPEKSWRGRRADLSVEALRMSPDPASAGQEVSFMVRLRNNGWPFRGTIRIQDSDQTVTQTDTVRIPRGLSDFNLPGSRYTFQRLDTCFTVSVDIDRTPYPVDASEEYCANPSSWTLKSRKRGHRGDRDFQGGGRPR